MHRKYRYAGHDCAPLGKPGSFLGHELADYVQQTRGWHIEKANAEYLRFLVEILANYLSLPYGGITKIALGGLATSIAQEWRRARDSNPFSA